MKRAALLIVALIVALAGVLLFRTVRLAPIAADAQKAPVIALDSAGIVARLSAALRIPTISDDRPISARAEPFLAFHRFLESSYPRVHTKLRREVVGGYSLLYTWTGTEPALEPILLMGHMDVVPVAPGSDSLWKQPPFSGNVVGDEIWGRGAIDDKPHVVSELEAVELLLAQGYRPRRTVLLAFGHDEELGGSSGAPAIASLLKTRDVKLQFVLDEGGMIGTGLVPGVTRPVALVRTAEKGYLSLQLTVRGVGGHSSAPPRQTPIGILSRAIVALESNRFPARLTAATRVMLRTAAPEMPFGQRIAIANLWLFEPLVKRSLSGTPATDATIRTTIAPTMLEGSPKDNVLPITARAVINFRLLPGDSSRGVIAHVRDAIDDERVELQPLVVSEPPVASNANAPAFALVSRTIREVAPDVLVSPFLLTGATDSRHFAALTDNIYGFSMRRGGVDVLQMAHGTNERIPVADLLAYVRFFERLIRNAAQ